MENKKNKKRKVAIGIGLALLAIVGGIVAYKKSPKFKGFVDSGVSKIKNFVKKDEESTPTFNTKPYRKYEPYKK